MYPGTTADGEEREEGEEWEGEEGEEGEEGATIRATRSTRATTMTSKFPHPSRAQAALWRHAGATPLPFPAAPNAEGCDDDEECPTPRSMSGQTRKG